MLVLFGGGLGNLGAQPLGDTWEFDGTTWTERLTPGPTPRSRHAMATLGGRVVLFGGSLTGQATVTELVSDTWTWDGSVWAQATPSSAPSARYAHAMATVGDKIILFGGVGGDDAGPTSHLADTWQWDGSNWTQLMIAGPTARAGHAMVPYGAGALLFGGDESGASDTWMFANGAWSRVATDLPVARFRHGMADRGSSVVMFGGQPSASTEPLIDTWAWDGGAWGFVEDGGGASARLLSSLAPFGGDVVLFGGWGLAPGGSAAGALADTWRWDGAAWSMLSPAQSPRARSGHAMAAR